MYQYEKGCCNEFENRYNAGKHMHFELIIELEEFHSNVCGVRFLLETDSYTMLH